MNGRRFSERIYAGNWKNKKEDLLKLLDAVNETDAFSALSKSNPKPFLSDTSLKAMRITIMSTIQLVEFLLDECGYDFVLSGKFNQDCLEVVLIVF